VHLYEWGDRRGRPLLYWDGLGGTGLHANEIGPLLARDYGFHMLAPDPPGHGRSPALPLDDYLPSRLAALAAELVPGRTGFLGFSVGAEVGCAFAARFPERTAALVLVDGGYWDFADLPDFDVDAGLDTRVARARAQAGDEVLPRAERYASWDAYFAEQAADLGRWTPELEAAHRATMRELNGEIVPILEPAVAAAISHGNVVEPTVATHAALHDSGVPVLLVLPDTHRWDEQVARFQRNVPQLEVRRLATAVHDLVSNAPEELARVIGDYAATCARY